MTTHNERLAGQLASYAKDGEVRHAFLDSEAGYWTAYFTTELGALRVYLTYGGSASFGNSRVKYIEEGPMAGCYRLTTFETRTSLSQCSDLLPA